MASGSGASRSAPGNAGRPSRLLAPGGRIGEPVDRCPAMFPPAGDEEGPAATELSRPKSSMLCRMRTRQKMRARRGLRRTLRATGLAKGAAPCIALVVAAGCSWFGAGPGKEGERCRPTPNHAGRDRHCAKGLTCFEEKTSSAAGTCVTSARAKELCAASPSCKTRGACGYHAGLGQCVARKAADCQASAACRADGRCTLKSRNCEVGSDADCKGSEACKRDGRCKSDGRATLAKCVK